MDTKTKIINAAKDLAAYEGISGLSIRQIGKKADVPSSVIYYYFSSKDDLLEAAFNETNRQLGAQRRKLSERRNAEIMLRQRIIFQLDNARDILFVLKYYIHFRGRFAKNEFGYIPEKGHLHIREVLEIGKKNGEFKIDNVDEDAKVIAHAINGFILEYFPDIPKGRDKDKLVDTIYKFLLKGLKGGDNV